MDVCDEEKVPHPIVVSESGRATVAHHAVLVVEAFGSIEKTPTETYVQQSPDHKLLRDLVYTQDHLSDRNLNESWHDLQDIKEESQKMFELGILDLRVKSRVEQLYWEIAEAIERRAATLEPDQVPEDLGDLRTQLADQHICNFSVFQSLLDHWALGQLFPIVPIHRLNERPTLQATLVDITCDSDGKVSKFIDLNDVRDTLPLHDVAKGPYYLGICLTGAYQDIMGDLHNLFGRVNEAHVFLDEDEDSGWYIEETLEGSTIEDVLKVVQWDQTELMRQMKSQVDASIKTDRLKPNEAMRLLASYEKALKGYTYLQFNHPAAAK
jgi:arginine decarboxylase